MVHSDYNESEVIYYARGKEKIGRRANGESCIYQAKDGTWFGVIQHGYKADGKPYRPFVTALTRGECEKKLRALRKKLESEDHTVVKK